MNDRDENFPEIQKFFRRENDKDTMKEAVKEAVKEWMDEQFTRFGKWTVMGIAAGTFALLVKFLVFNHYWPGN
jgi:hypothetical protein